jgi:hypothetical protein
MIDIRLPNITATTEAGKMAQMQSYMHQLVEQLNWALNTVESAQSGNASPAVVLRQGTEATPQDAESTFNSIKALIIKSADIVKAYEQTILSDFNGIYFADSDFGTFIEQTNRKVEENSKGVTETYKNIQTITNADGTGSLDILAEDVRTTNAYIKRGLLGYDNNGNAVYGIEVGETNEDGAFLKYARFISDRLSFFDLNGDEVAYIGAGCLYVNGKTVFLGEIQLGGYKTDTTDGLAFTWIE